LQTKLVVKVQEPKLPKVSKGNLKIEFTNLKKYIKIQKLFNC